MGVDVGEKEGKVDFRWLLLGEGSICPAALLAMSERLTLLSID